MAIIEVAVTLTGLAAIAFLAWFFFGPKQAQAALRLGCLSLLLFGCPSFLPSLLPNLTAPPKFKLNEIVCPA